MRQWRACHSPSLPVIALHYPARAWITEIDRRDIAKVRDFTIIIDEGRIINAVIAVERVHVTTRVTVVLLLGRFDTDT